MKRNFLFAGLLSLLILFLTSCSGNPYPFIESTDEIVSIEIVSAESSLEFTVLKTLSEEERKDFLEQFQSMDFYKYLGDPSGVPEM